jgi:hypothetical protein
MNDILYTNNLKYLKNKYNNSYLYDIINNISDTQLRELLTKIGVKYKPLEKLKIVPPAYINVGHGLSKIFNILNDYIKNNNFTEFENFISNINLYDFSLFNEKFIYTSDSFFNTVMSNEERKFILDHESSHIKDNYFFTCLEYVYSISNNNDLLKFCFKSNSGLIFNILSDYLINNSLSKKYNFNIQNNKKFFFHYIDDTVLKSIFDLDNNIIKEIQSKQKTLDLYNYFINYLYEKNYQKSLLNLRYPVDMLLLNDNIKKYCYFLYKLNNSEISNVNVYKDNIYNIITQYNNILLYNINSNNEIQKPEINPK